MSEPPSERARRDVLQQALEGLRERVGEAQERAASRFTADDFFELFERARRFAGTLGMQERSGEVDEFGLDPVVCDAARPWLRFLATRWWRIEVRGLDDVPAEQPVLFVANRSGVLPWDGLMLAHHLEAWHPRGERPRFLVADWLVTLPFAQPWLARLGGVRACRENAERLLRSGRSVIAFPEGAKGATKPFADRYRVQRFGRGGVVRLAVACGVPIVPVAVVGAEEAHPILWKVETFVRRAGVPFVPVTPTFPWLGPLGALPLPSKWLIRFGAPLEIEGLAPEDARDEILVSRLTEELRARIQAMLDSERRSREGVFA